MSYAREEKVFLRPCIFGKKLFKEYVIINDRHVNFSDLSLVVFLFLLPITPWAKGCLNFERIYFVTLGCVQTDAITPNIVAPTILEVVACVLAVVCKRMQQLPTMLGPAVIQHCCATLRRSRNKRNVGSCWLKSLTGFKLCSTTRNNIQQHATGCANGRKM